MPFVLSAPMHVEPELPLSTEAALPIMALGGLVLAVVAYDAYRVYGDRVAPETNSDDV
jgi:hypothetical protein